MTRVLDQTFMSRTQHHLLLSEAPGASWPALTARPGERVGVLTGDGQMRPVLRRTEVPWRGQVEVADLPGHPGMARRCLVPVVSGQFSVRFLAGVISEGALDLVVREGQPVALRDLSGQWSSWGTPEEAVALVVARPSGTVLHRVLI